MKIIDIMHTDTGETRKDGRYPLRIGSEVEFCVEPCIDNVMLLSYIKDNQGNSKEGILRTSTVKSIARKDSKIIITTKNSIYVFQDEKEGKNE